MARGSCARAQRGRSGRRPGRAGAGILAHGWPVSGRPDAGPVPGGADAGEAGPTPAAAGTGQDAGAAGPAADSGARLAGSDPDPDAELAGIDPDAGHELAAIGPGDGAGRAETGRGAGAAPAGTTRARVMSVRLAGGWPLRRTFLVGFVIVTLVALAAIVVGGTALANLASARDRVVNKIDPAALGTSQLGVAYLNQETGVRGYALSARPTFLAPYSEGLVQERRQVSALRRLLTGLPVA